MVVMIAVQSGVFVSKISARVSFDLREENASTNSRATSLRGQKPRQF